MRIILLLAGLSAALGCATPAPAAAYDAAQGDPIAACARQAAPDARQACVGLVSRPCLETDEGSTTPGAAACFGRERAMWEALRDAIAGALRDTESASQGALRDAALAEHSRWAQAHCAYAASIYEGGSLARVVGAQCMRDAAAEFALELIGRADER